MLAYVSNVPSWCREFLENDGEDGEDEAEQASPQPTPKLNHSKARKQASTKTRTTTTAAKVKQKETPLPLWNNDDERSLPSSPLKQVKRKRSENYWDSDGLNELDELLADVLEKESEPQQKRGKWDAFLKKK